MQLYDGQPASLDCVVYRPGRVCVCSRIYQNAGESVVLCRADPVDEHSLMVRLAAINFQAQRQRQFRQLIVNGTKCRSTVNARFTTAEPVQVRSANN